MSTNHEIPTIEDYLQLNDWTFAVSMSEGSHSNFLWLRSSELAAVDLLETIDLPNQMLLDEPIADREILHALSNFDEPNMLEDLEEEQAKNFWAALEAVKPYCYFSYGLFDGFTFVARGHDLYRQFLDRASERDIEAIHREMASANRARTWQELGPECGPEICIEHNCERLRIKLAVRCFIHQIQWGRA